MLTDFRCNTVMVLPKWFGGNIMRVTTKGQVTIPVNVREELGIIAETDIDFMEENGRFYIVKISEPKKNGQFNRFRGIATAKMTTDEIMKLTR